jgi:sn-glycerol 3-phosphate transport system ATP-binding protein/multiple sugar transport system ATP-binding protein
MRLSLAGIEKKLGGSPILKGIDLDVASGELVVLVGPSGCGKSTLLRTIAGLELPDAGTITLGERDVTRAEPRERDIGMVFQSYALYPHLTVRENLAFGLTLRGESAATIESRVSEVAEMLGLGKLLARYPRDMSGGQRQRVAMGRAIARRPKLFLFDEPLSNLDAALRAEVRVEIKRLHARLSATMIYVTHDQVEAMTLADRLVVLRAGVIEQVGPPLEVYEKPASRFVAGFLGSPAMNFLDVSIANGRAKGEGVDVAVHAGEGEAVLGVRPQDLALASEGEPPGGIALTVEVIEAMGFEAYVHGKVGASTFVARLSPEELPRAKVGAVLSLVPKRTHLFDRQSGKVIV